ncbi:MAG: YbjN domain-containing protein [Coriobacteriales bacterium]|nr:YbjN domain-containing protein [Coriobacteriales bacterium]
MASGSANLIAFQTALDQRNIVYNEMENSKIPAVRIRYNMENMERIDVFFWFDPDGETMHFGSGVIAHVPENKTDVALRAINEANVNYRWLTFFLDKDNDIVASGDAILSPNVVGDTCHELLNRTLNICDEAYSKFMKAIWA